MNKLTREEVLSFIEKFHDAYEDAIANRGHKANARYGVPFSRLPEESLLNMLDAATKFTNAIHQQAYDAGAMDKERELSAAQATIKRLEGEISDTPRKLGLSVIEQLSALTNEQRLGIFGLFCTHCGCDDPRCQCWNDE